MSHKKVHWAVQDECKLGLVHRWQASPNSRVKQSLGAPFPFGQAVCVCNSLAVQCPEAAGLWDQACGSLIPDNITVGSEQVMFWRAPDIKQWQQVVQQVVKLVKRRRRSTLSSLG